MLKWMFRVRTWLLALVGVALLTSSAVAVAPDHETLIDEGLFAFPDLDCGGVELTYELVSERVKVTTYFNRNGDPVREKINANIRGTFTNNATGDTFRDHGAFRIEVDPATGDALRISGLTASYTVPGEGVVYHESGIKIYDETGTIVFAAGPKDFEEQGLDGICTALT